MKGPLLLLLGIVLVGVAIVFHYLGPSVVGGSSEMSPDQNSLPEPQARNNQTASGAPSQVEVPRSPNESRSKGRPLVFPDGEILEIIWREAMRPTVRQFGIDNYEILREAALNGDAIASIMLYEMQRNCESRYESEEELEAAIDQLYQTHTIPVPGRKQPNRLADPEKVALMEEMMRSIHSRCEKLLAYQGNFEEKWLERSANDGWAGAMIELGQQQENQDSAKELYRAAWDAGSAAGLGLLSEIVKQSYETGKDPSANIEAFAMLHTSTIIETTLLKGQGRIAGRHVARLQAKLDEERKLLLPQELQEALEMSKLMIRSNPNCCYGE